MKLLCALVLCALVAFAHGVSPEENRGNRELYEGDMRLTPEQARNLYARREKRATVRDTRRLWPRGQAFYVIDRSLGAPARRVINQAIADYQRLTCIRLRPRTNQGDYINFRIGDGCASWVGRIGGRQDIWLARGCWTKGIVIHEIGHALGFYHEQSRPDRDKFVEILTRNIIPGTERNFRKMNSRVINSFGFPYDFRSVMHYGARFFSRNGQPTIRVKQAGVSIGNRNGLSPGDRNQVTRLYRSCRVTGSFARRKKTNNLKRHIVN